MNILLYEAVTAGLMGSALTEALLPEAEAMLQATLRDFIDLQDVRVWIPRLPSLPSLHVDGCQVIIPSEDPTAPFRQQFDAILIIAPESEDLLLQLSRAADESGARRLGSSLDAIEATSDKFKSFTRMRAGGIPTPDTWLISASIPDLPQGYVVKPIDGCGAEGVRRYSIGQMLRQDLTVSANNLVQSYVEGIDASVLCFFKEDEVTLLSINQQHLAWSDSGHAEFLGVTTGSFESWRSVITPLMASLTTAFPGLYGFVGIDFIMTSTGPVVIEINPRLTSAYPELRGFLGYNPALLWFNRAPT